MKNRGQFEQFEALLRRQMSWWFLRKHRASSEYPAGRFWQIASDYILAINHAAARTHESDQRPIAVVEPASDERALRETRLRILPLAVAVQACARILSSALERN